jgi:hypothetical protein
MIHTETNLNTKTDDSQEVTVTKQQYEEQLAERIAAKNVAEAKERGIPLWMLTGFPATSSEPDQDDDVAFEEG